MVGARGFEPPTPRSRTEPFVRESLRQSAISAPGPPLVHDLRMSSAPLQAGGGGQLAIATSVKVERCGLQLAMPGELLHEHGIPGQLGKTADELVPDRGATPIRFGDRSRGPASPNSSRQRLARILLRAAVLGAEDELA